MWHVKRANEFTPKSWGYESLIDNRDYCGKILFFHKGKMGSLHYHQEKAETFFILSGRVEVDVLSLTMGPLGYEVPPDFDRQLETVLLGQGESIYLPPGTAHRVEALYDTTIIEVSTPHKDEDTFRIVPAS